MSRSWYRLMAILVKNRRAFVIAIQAALMVLANYLAFWLRFDGAIPEYYIQLCFLTLPLLVAVRLVIFIPFRLYQDLWRYAGIWDLRNIIGGVLSSTLAFYALIHWGFGLIPYPRSVFIVDSLLLIFFLGGIRLARRIHRELAYVERQKRVLIYGAGDIGEMIVRDMRNNESYEYEPVGFVDDDPAKRGQTIHGVPILGTRQDLPKIMAAQKPDEVLVAIPRAEPKTIREVVKILEPFKVPITTLPNLHDLYGGKVVMQQIRKLSIEDLLARAPVGLDPGPIHRLIAGKRVLVTGAGGSIGSELCRQIAALRPRALVLYERYENGLYAISCELSDRDGSLPIHSVIGDVTDPLRVDAVMAEYRPEIIFHAAAHKHVPMMELNPCEAIKNNVIGTRVVAEAAARRGAERFVLISSDKAVNPSSIMGASKRVAELTMQHLDGHGQTRFVIVRFGNVLGSSGSIVPRFMEQIKAGGPVTVTHPEVYRYFMLIPEAVQLVLHAATQQQTDAIYVLQMGEPISVLDMARNLIRLSGFVPEEEIPIEFVGLRPGEKLFEDLIGSDEVAEPSGVDGILKIRPTSLVEPVELRQRISTLEQLATRGHLRATVEQLSKIVPTFLYQRGERRRRPPRYRAGLVRNTLPVLERCVTVEALQALLEEVRKDLGFLTLQVRIEEGAAPAILNGIKELTVVDSTPPQDPDLVNGGGVSSWTGRAEILSKIQNADQPEGTRTRNGGEGRGPRAESQAVQVVGEVVVTKPAWKHRRTSENDDELVQLLADAFGKWLAERMKA